MTASCAVCFTHAHVVVAPTYAYTSQAIDQCCSLWPRMALHPAPTYGHVLFSVQGAATESAPKKTELQHLLWYCKCASISLPCWALFASGARIKLMRVCTYVHQYTSQSREHTCDRSAELLYERCFEIPAVTGVWLAACQVYVV